MGHFAQENPILSKNNQHAANVPDTKTLELRFEKFGQLLRNPTTESFLNIQRAANLWCSMCAGQFQKTMTVVVKKFLTYTCMSSQTDVFDVRTQYTHTHTRTHTHTHTHTHKFVLGNFKT